MKLLYKKRETAGLELQKVKHEHHLRSIKQVGNLTKVDQMPLHLPLQGSS
jgi:hypothetical protein